MEHASDAREYQHLAAEFDYLPIEQASVLDGMEDVEANVVGQATARNVIRRRHTGDISVQVISAMNTKASDLFTSPGSSAKAG